MMEAWLVASNVVALGVRRRLRWAAHATVAAWLAAAPAIARAQVAWEFSDTHQAAVATACVRDDATRATPCCWLGGDCDGDGIDEGATPGVYCHRVGSTSIGAPDSDLSDCCTAVPIDADRSVGEQIDAWYRCFGYAGNHGGIDISRLNPPARGRRWHEMLHAMLADLDRFRDERGLPRIEPIEPCPGVGIPWAHHGCDRDDASACGSFHVDPATATFTPPGRNRPAGLACNLCEPLPSCLYRDGAGPAACPPKRGCEAPGECVGGPTSCALLGDERECSGAPGCTWHPPDVLLRHRTLDDFTSIEELTALLDTHLHQTTYGAIALAGICTDGDTNGHANGGSRGDARDEARGESNGDANGHANGIADGESHRESSGDCARATTPAACEADGCRWSMPDSCADILQPRCAARDPALWGLARTVDDVVRAWRYGRPADVAIIAGDGDADEQAAAALLADLLRDDLPHRVGVVARTGDGAAVQLELTASAGIDLGAVSKAVAAGARDASGSRNDRVRDSPDSNTDTAAADRASGHTKRDGENRRHHGDADAGLTSALDTALALLCPARSDRRGDPPSCAADDYRAADGHNDRKAVVVMVAGDEPAPLGALALRRLGTTQICALSSPAAATLSGAALTALADRQDGLYAVDEDLLAAAVDCFAEVGTELVATTQKRTLAADRLAAEPVYYESADDLRLTFAATWNEEVAPGQLRLLLTSPTGMPVRALASTTKRTDPADTPREQIVERSARRRWSFVRVGLPYRGSSAGRWRAQLVRPYRSFVNAFRTDAFTDAEGGAALALRQIDRLCADRCTRVLYFEDGRRGPRSAYADALQHARHAHVIDDYVAATDAQAFAGALAESWDLIVYAHQMDDDAAPYDGALIAALCAPDQRSIVTDTRAASDGAGAIAGRETLACAGATATQPIDGVDRVANAGGLLDADLVLAEPRHAESGARDHGLLPRPGAYVEARWAGSSVADAAVVATGLDAGDDGGAAAEARDRALTVHVLADGLSRLTPAQPNVVARAGDAASAAVRILPSFGAAHGYRDARMTVAITGPDRECGRLDGAAAQCHRTYELNDDGRDGDAIGANGVWTAQLPGRLAPGLHRYRFAFEYQSSQGRVRRELVQDVFVDP